ncbi:MAG TPA: hypothetical protein VK559_07550 [Ferruginibacter sp.]|nr:hypothetical protein [Ferruginibacter sp.]
MKVFHLPIIALLALISFASCKKSSNSGLPKGTLTATIDDTAYNFNGGVEAEGFNIGAEYGFSADYADTLNDNEFTISMARFDSSKLALKTYYETDSLVEIDIEFDHDGIEYDNGFTKIAPFQITLTSPNQGTFSGKVYPNGDSTLPAKVITNGKFNFLIY